jgi:hypothetical protein
MALRVMTDRVARCTDGLAEAMVEVERAKTCMRQESADAGAEIARAKRALQRALGTMSLARWEALVSGQAYLRTARDSREANMARRRRSAVERSITELSMAEVVGLLRVERAQARLDDAMRGLERFGPLAAGLLSDEWRQEVRDFTAAMGVHRQFTRRPSR